MPTPPPARKENGRGGLAESCPDRVMSAKPPEEYAAGAKAAIQKDLIRRAQRGEESRQQDSPGAVHEVAGIERPGDGEPDHERQQERQHRGPL